MLTLSRALKGFTVILLLALVACSKAPSDNAVVDVNTAFDGYKAAFLEAFRENSPE